MAENAITLYCIGCEPAILPHKDFFAGLAHITGGQYCPLADSRLLRDVIVGGAREEIALESLVGEVDRRANEIADLAPEEQTRRVWTIMKEANVKCRQLQVNNSEMAAPSRDAISISEAADLASVRKTFTPSDVSPSRSRARMWSAAPAAYAAPAHAVATPAAAPMSYRVAEDEEVSMAQVSRMIQKSKARNADSWASKK